VVANVMKNAAQFRWKARMWGRANEHRSSLHALHSASTGSAKCGIGAPRGIVPWDTGPAAAPSAAAGLLPIIAANAPAAGLTAACASCACQGASSCVGQICWAVKVRPARAAELVALNGAVQQ
jgi:hypothetical protein